MTVRAWLRRLFDGHPLADHQPSWEEMDAARRSLDDAQGRVRRLRALVELRARGPVDPPDPPP